MEGLAYLGVHVKPQTDQTQIYGFCSALLLMIKICIYICKTMYLYIHIYIYTYICIHVYIYIHISFDPHKNLCFQLPKAFVSLEGWPMNWAWDPAQPNTPRGQW